MSDATGHFNWPDSGPFTTQLTYKGIHANYYCHPDAKTGWFLIIRGQPTDEKDTLVKGGFRDIFHATAWLENEISSGRLTS